MRSPWSILDVALSSPEKHYVYINYVVPRLWCSSRFYLNTAIYQLLMLFKDFHYSTIRFPSSFLPFSTMPSQQSNSSPQSGSHYQEFRGLPSSTSSDQWSTTAQRGSPTPPPNDTHNGSTKKEHKVKDTEHDLRGIGSQFTKYVLLIFCPNLVLIPPLWPRC